MLSCCCCNFCCALGSLFFVIFGLCLFDRVGLKLVRTFSTSILDRCSSHLVIWNSMPSIRLELLPYRTVNGPLISTRAPFGYDTVSVAFWQLRRQRPSANMISVPCSVCSRSRSAPVSKYIQKKRGRFAFGISTFFPNSCGAQIKWPSGRKWRSMKSDQLPKFRPSRSPSWEQKLLSLSEKSRSLSMYCPVDCWLC